MKTLVSDTLSKYLLEDDAVVTLNSDNIVIGDLLVCDLNSSNTTVYENVTDAPEDWVGCKYTYDGTTWTQSENWVEKEIIADAE